MAHASEMWDLLKPIGDIHQLHDLKEQLSNLRLTQFESASKFLGKAKELWDHISHMNETFVTEGDFIQILVGILKKVPGVPNPYSPLIQQIGYKYMEGHQDVYTWKWFLRALLAMEKQAGPLPTKKNRLQTAYLGNNYTGCYNCGSKDHKIAQCKKPRRRDKPAWQRRPPRRNNKNTPHQPIAMMATTEEEEAKDPILGPLDGSDQDINSDEDGENMADNPSWLGSALTCVEEELENNKQQESATNAHVAHVQTQTKDDFGWASPGSAREHVRVQHHAFSGSLSAELAMVIDSGCSQHMFNLPSECFTALDTVRTTITTGGGKITAAGKGTLELWIEDSQGEEQKILMKDCLRVPSLPVSLLSVSRLCKNHIDVQFGNEECLLSFEQREELVLVADKR